MEINENIHDLTKFYNGLATVLEDCNERIETFIESEEKEQLVEKAKYIQNYF
jgi:hypothetical protein